MTEQGRLARLRDEMTARDRLAYEDAERDRMRDLAITSLQCMAWVLAGLALIGWAFHTTSMTWGRIAFLSGIGIGNAGWIFTILAAHRRGEQRGDW